MKKNLLMVVCAILVSCTGCSSNEEMTIQELTAQDNGMFEDDGYGVEVTGIENNDEDEYVTDWMIHRTRKEITVNVNDILAPTGN